MSMTGAPVSDTVTLPANISAWLGDDALRAAAVGAIRSLETNALTAVCSTVHSPRIAMAVAAHYTDRRRAEAAALGSAGDALPFLTTFLSGATVRGGKPLAEQLWALQTLGISSSLLRLVSLIDVAFVRADSDLLVANDAGSSRLEHLVCSDLVVIDARHLPLPPRLEVPPTLQRLLSLHPRPEISRKVLLLAAGEDGDAVVVDAVPPPAWRRWRLRAETGEGTAGGLRSQIREKCRLARKGSSGGGDVLAFVLQGDEQPVVPAYEPTPIPNLESYAIPNSAAPATGVRDREDPYRPSDVPSPPRRRARPTPDTVEGQERVQRRLDRSITRFFDAVPPSADASGEDDEDAALHAFEGCSLELQTIPQMALQVQMGPLAWLPATVRRITIQAPMGTVVTAASNVRSRRWAVTLPWATGKFRVTVDAPTSLELATQLDTLAFDGPSGSEITIFELRTDGAGAIVPRTRIASGRSYALLAPPGFAQRLATVGTAQPLSGGWSVCRLAPPGLHDASLADRLHALGIELLSPRPELRWVGLPPHCYRATPRGENYPCLLQGEDPAVLVASTSAMGASWLAVHGPEGLRSQPLVSGQEQLFVLDGLLAGRHVVELACADPDFEPVRLPFEVLASPEMLTPPRIELVLAGQTHTAPCTVTPRDLGDVTAEDLVVRGIPFWPIEVAWRGLSRVARVATELDGDGVLDVAALLEATRSAREHDPGGELILDGRDLGSLVLGHRRDMSSVKLRTRLTELLVSSRAVCEAAIMTRDAAMLTEHWIDPILRILGFQLGTALPASASIEIVFWTLLGLPSSPGALRATRVGLFGLVVFPEGLRAAASDALRAAARTVCEAEGASFVLLSDGWDWTRVLPFRNARGRVCDVRWFGDPARAEDAEDFLERFAAQAM